MKKFINARLKGNEQLVEILTDNGKIIEISFKTSGKDGEIEEVIDLEGNLVVPPYVALQLEKDCTATKTQHSQK